MLTRISVVVLSSLFLSAAFHAQVPAASAPEFSQYKAEPAFTGTPAIPQMNTKNAKRFHTVIREGSAKGPNFDGHYTVVEWGCGAGCAQFSIVDAATGKVYDPLFPGVSFESAEGKFVSDSGIRYQPDSSLMMINGCPGGKDCAAWYYEWTGAELKLIKEGPAKFE
jgi:hypothetical protein